LICALKGQLAERLGVGQATISIMIRPMEKCGLVERHCDKEEAGRSNNGLRNKNG
jgi:DNA-binding MarR family transcriptional regulator